MVFPFRLRSGFFLGRGGCDQLAVSILYQSIPSKVYTHIYVYINIYIYILILIYMCIYYMQYIWIVADIPIISPDGFDIVQVSRTYAYIHIVFVMYIMLFFWVVFGLVFRSVAAVGAFGFWVCQFLSWASWFWCFSLLLASFGFLGSVASRLLDFCCVCCFCCLWLLAFLASVAAWRYAA